MIRPMPKGRRVCVQVHGRSNLVITGVVTTADHIRAVVGGQRIPIRSVKAWCLASPTATEVAA